MPSRSAPTRGPDRRTGDPAAPRPRPAYLVALFVAITWGAVAFAVSGILAVVLDRDPVEAEVAPFTGLVSFALAGVVVWLAAARSAVSRTPWMPALAALGGVYLVMTGFAALLGLPSLVEQASSPFVLADAVLAGLAAVGAWAGIRRWAK
ncbi:hypothetical protein [Homoserinibacter sp. YIM 151385]|uniref:hypothetical protein n=1 Tax=Homoserinibacter sp. YIM 151385 TaxID=2985506 RepID=UPI0022F12C8A|nr:hypothetical protein [Homoserinibacter sp. YIM 151385]WBU37642.1 hypothetical protein OF852_12080 [Homoserinibacter sp. YIM 151385]